VAIIDVTQGGAASASAASPPASASPVNVASPPSPASLPPLEELLLPPLDDDELVPPLEELLLPPPEDELLPPPELDEPLLLLPPEDELLLLLDASGEPVVSSPPQPAIVAAPATVPATTQPNTMRFAPTSFVMKKPLSIWGPVCTTRPHSDGRAFAHARARSPRHWSRVTH
jgi:hypothetical protein